MNGRVKGAKFTGVRVRALPERATALLFPRLNGLTDLEQSQFTVTRKGAASSI
jgi:hypothetical protein